MPAWISTSGPRFGYRPEIDGLALSTAATPDRDERVGGDAVEVDVVDDRDVTRAQPPDQALGPAVEAGGAGTAPGSTLRVRRKVGSRIVGHPDMPDSPRPTRHARVTHKTGHISRTFLLVRHASNSSACAMPRSESGRPASIRASSRSARSPRRSARRSW
jgi:hypothetical protein